MGTPHSEEAPLGLPPDFTWLIAEHPLLGRSRPSSGFLSSSRDSPNSTSWHTEPYLAWALPHLATFASVLGLVSSSRYPRPCSVPAPAVLFHTCAFPDASSLAHLPALADLAISCLIFEANHTSWNLLLTPLLSHWVWCPSCASL